jgi:VanZ family protein
MARVLSLWTPPLLVMALIFVGSSLPSDGADRGLAGLLGAKAIHLSEYFALLLALWRALRAALGARRGLAAAFAACLLYAGSDEFHQSFVEGRNPSVADVAIDAVGAGSAAVLVLRGRRGRRARRST